ncbi:MAG: metal-dependent transcriptional regulator [Eubacteriales bacterium]
MKIFESAENYLEAILMLLNRQEFVRSVDVAKHLQISKASVSVAMKSLHEAGYIDIAPGGHLSLTEKGTGIAEQVYERHTLLTRLFRHLGVSRAVAEEDACRIEHRISQETVDKLRAFVNTMIPQE